jgi:hypothetical protein
MQNPYSYVMAKRPPAPPAVPEPTRAERAITYMMFSILGLSVIAIIALIVGGPTKSGAIWTSVALVPFIGLPLGFILLIVLVVLSSIRRGRAAKVASK